MTDIGTFLKDMFLTKPGAYVSVFGPDKAEKRFGIDEDIKVEAWKSGGYWLTVREPPGVILISEAPFQLFLGETYQAKPVIEWGIEYV
jgi:hypothetical protein